MEEHLDKLSLTLDAALNRMVWKEGL